MYSKNDYRYYLEHRLISDDYLSHHGVLGMRWGVRRYQSYSTVPRKSGDGGKEIGLAKKKARLQSKVDKNNAKIKKYQDELKKPSIVKDEALQKKYQAKLDKVNASYFTKRAERREAKGKDLGIIGERNLWKRANYEAKLAKASIRPDTLRTKIADLEYKNAKLDKKINKIDTKITSIELRRGNKNV